MKKNAVISAVVALSAALALAACAPPNENDSDLPNADTATVGATSAALNDDTGKSPSQTHDVAPSEDAYEASLESESSIADAENQMADQGVDQPVEPVDVAPESSAAVGQ